LRVIATADLGGLGAREGPAIAYQWDLLSQLPPFLPGLALLLLLLLKRNRSLQALWIAAPLALFPAATWAFWADLPIPADMAGGIFDILFGLGAVWLLSPYLKARRGFITFLGMLATMEFFTLFSLLVGKHWDPNSGPADMLMLMSISGLLFTLVLNLAGWSCRGRFGWRRLSLWLLFWIMAVWLVFFTLMSLWHRPGPLLEMATALLSAAAMSLGFLLPFLLLSFTNAFYRERLKELLRLADAAPPSAAQPPAA